MSNEISWIGFLGLPIALLLGCGSKPSEGTSPQAGDAGADAVVSDAAVETHVGDSDTAAQRLCQESGWCWELPAPQGNDLYAAWAFSGEDAWFVGDGGTILHFVNGSWFQPMSPTKRALRAIWALNERSVWAVGDHANVLHFDGSVWSLLAGSPEDPEPTDAGPAQLDGSVEDVGAEASVPSLPPDENLHAIVGASDSDLWVAGTGGTLAHFDGEDWLQYDPSTESTLHVLWSDAEGVWYAAGDKVVLRFDGVAWTPETMEQVQTWIATSSTSDSDRWLLGENNHLAHYDGATWEFSRVPGPQFRTIVAATADSVWAFGDQGTAGHWDGTQWLVASSDPLTRWFGAGQFSPDRFFVAGSGGAITQWRDGFRASMSLSLATDFRAIAGSGATDVWAAGDLLVKTDNRAWVPVTSEPTAIFGLWIGDSQGWAVGAGGAILKRTGDSFEAVESPTAEWLRGVHCWTEASCWAVGRKGMLLSLLYGEWVVMPASSQPNLNGVWGPEPGNVWAVGDNATILRWSKGSWKAEQVDPGDAGTVVRENLHGVWGASVDDVWAVGDRGTILRRDDVGWRVEYQNPEVNLHAVWGRSASDVWAVGEPGAVFHYDGAAWVQVDVGTRADLRGVWGVARSTWVVGSGGVILGKHDD